MKTFLVFTGLFLLYFSYHLYSLVSGSYKLHPAEYYKLDTITLQSKAYATRSSVKITKAGYDFQDTMWLNYRIDRPQYYAIRKPELIADTLRYHRTKLVVYSDKSGLAAYRTHDTSAIIMVYQFSIGGKEYIDFAVLNANTKRNTIYALLLCTAGYLIYMAWYLNRRRKRENKNPDQ